MSLFEKIRGALNSIHLFGCLRGTLVFSKVLGGLFVSSETVSYPAGFGRKFKDEDSTEGLDFLPKFSRDLCELQSRAISW